MSTNQNAGWRPILDGELRACALDSIYAIADCLRAYPRTSKAPFGASFGASLASGPAGMALLFHYLALTDPGMEHPRWAQHLLGQAEDAVASLPMGASLYDGFPGVAWAAQHIDGELEPGPDGVDRGDDVDLAVLELVGRSPWRRDYDVVNGLVGLGVYALERFPHPAASECLVRIIQRLEELVVADQSGLTFHTPYELLRSVDAAQHHPHGYYNLGVAHGVPGVLAFVGSVDAAGVCQDRTRRLMLGMLDWIWAQRLPDGCAQESRESVFPLYVGPGLEPQPARTTWCYGDPGISVAMLLAARAVGDGLWEERALWLARKVAMRPAERTGVIDAGLCHGASGMAHMLNRLFQATGEEMFRQSARSWFRRALDMRDPQRGLAGYLTYELLADGATYGWIEDPGVLTGVAGIGLALLGALTPIEPAWDGMLLTSLPPRLTTARADKVS